jgi:DNA-binding NtrC family response regulator
MLAIFRYVASVAPSSRPLFITGETGTGKDLLAEAAHSLSAGAGPLVRVNAAGLDDALFTDTLFGHVRGAYTGAETSRPGLVEKAEGGTLFLDEIGDLNPASQVKLLGLIQNREYMKIGDDRVRHSSARIIAATNRDILELKRPGAFRQDLYFRLMTHHVRLPPLRERPEDIPLLLDHFMEKAAAALNTSPPTADPEILTVLCAYPFPGNVRELQAMVFDAVTESGARGILSAGAFRRRMEVLPPDAVPDASPAAGTDDLDRSLAGLGSLPSLKQAAESLVAEALRRSRGNQAQAARMLGISRQALNKRLQAAPPTLRP